ncbi:MAG: hypothetical protein Q9M89_00480 [Persephonella sp.]|nr:hypothetical protein [Persephonella sp.]
MYGVPVKLGAHGIEEVIKLDFTEEEKKDVEIICKLCKVWN